MIYHFCPGDHWPPPGDAYTPAGYAGDGFVHCSFLHQVAATATALHRGEPDLVILSIDEAGLPLVVEDCYDAGEEYPHVYGPIPVASVRAVTRFPCRPDGSFDLPPDLPPDLSAS